MNLIASDVLQICHIPEEEKEENKWSNLSGKILKCHSSIPSQQAQTSCLHPHFILSRPFRGLDWMGRWCLVKQKAIHFCVTSSNLAKQPEGVAVTGVTDVNQAT